MVHGREDVPVALFKPYWKQLLPGQSSPQKPVPKLQKQKRFISLLQILPLLKERLLRSLAGWRIYFKQPILPSSLAYTLLFFNVVLSPGGLIFAFLASWGLGGMAAATFKGGCAGVPNTCFRLFPAVQAVLVRVMRVNVLLGLGYERQ